jgi:opacity protein-like surface antigen
VFREGRLTLMTLGMTSLLTVFLSSRVESQVCFRGHPRPRCSGFGVLEFSGAARLNRKVGPSDQAAAFMFWNAGYLHNVGPRSALGAVFKLTADSDGHRYGPAVRYRRWLSPTWGLDLTPGFYAGGQSNFTTLRFPSATADIAINWGDRIGVTVGVDAVRQAGLSTSWEGYAGLRFGTWLTPLATVGLGLLTAAAWN